MKLRYTPILFVLSLYSPAFSQTTATIDIDTTTTAPVRPGFSGFNNAATQPMEAWDYNFNGMATQLNPGWIRFPGGVVGDAFNWQTGLEVPNWISQFDPTTVDGMTVAQQANWSAGKGGGKFIDYANEANLFGANIVVCANAFTDTPQSIGQMAAYAKANGIHVIAWELANEAYNETEFFATGADYVNKVKPFRDAIKAADPNAIVSIFFESRAPKSAWNLSIAGVANKWWDAASYHSYPAVSGTSFATAMADGNANLSSETAGYISNYLAGYNPPGTLIIASEFNPGFGTGGVNQALTTGTLYGAVYAAEFIMRMSVIPSVLVAGPHAIFNDDGVNSSDFHYSDVNAAAQAGKTIDTSTLNFGFFYGAESQGLAVLNPVMKHAVKSDKTTVTGGATVPATGEANVPALYAQAYTSASGALSMVITNKSATAQQVTIRMNGTAMAGTFPIQFVTGTDPTAVNTANKPTAVAMQSTTSANPVTVPPYSVVGVSLITPAVATLVHAASYQAGALAPEQLVSAFGSGFAAQAIGASSQPLPTILGDTTISITDSAGTVAMAPLDYVSPGQANFQIPAGLAAGTASMKVMRNGSSVLTGSFTVAPVAPGLFAANGNGAGVVAGAGSRVAASGTTTPLSLYSCTNGFAFSCRDTPLALGASTDTLYVTFYGTGIRAAKSVQAYVGGNSVPVAYAGPQGSFAGLDQINITLPRTLAGTGETSLYLVVDNQISNVVSLNIQ
jgi:uncharacterized protein (TIGR03437 family)